MNKGFANIALVLVVILGAAGWWYLGPSTTTVITPVSDTATTSPSSAAPAPVQKAPVSDSKTITTSNGFSFSIPSSWSTKQTEVAGEPTSTGFIAHSNVIAISDSAGLQVAEVACPVSLRYEGPYETKFLVQESKTFKDSSGASYKMSYEETQSLMTVKDGQRVETIFMEIQPSVLPEVESGMGKVVSKGCHVLATGSAYWFNKLSGYAPLSGNDIAVVKNIFETWAAIK